MSVKPVQLDIYRTAIPMRRFEHAAAGREVAEAIVVRLELSDGAEGWGETLPREYVTGETLASVVRDLSELIWPACKDLDFDDSHDWGHRARCTAIEAPNRLMAIWRPLGDLFAHIPDAGAGGRCINAAVCAFQLAAMVRFTGTGGEVAPSEAPSAACRVWRPPSRGRAGRISARVSGVLGSSDPARTSRRLRLMRLMGLRDFKLKLGFSDDADAENLRIVTRQIGGAIRSGRCTLRVDVNGGWPSEETPARVAELKQYGVCVVEQPVFGPPEELIQLAQRCELPLMADESLVTAADSEQLVRGPRRIWWNIRVSKNGGFLGAAALTCKARENGIPFTVGCMVGESSILSAAQRRLLAACPQPRFVEGNYGKFLLADDLTTRSLRFGYGGRLRPLKGPGLGVRVDRRKLARYGKLVLTLRA